MIQIRKNVFETNSSSCHSVSISKGVETNNNLQVIDGEVFCQAGEFGWEIVDYNDAQTKLDYLITMAADTTVGTSYYNSTDDCQLIEDFIETDEFKDIQECVREVTGCKNLIVNSLYGYIDHQSLYTSIYSFLSENNLTIEQFIFGNVILHTDNDNH